MRKVTYWMLWFFVFMLPWENVALVPGWGTWAKVIGMGVIVLGGVNILVVGRFRWHGFYTVSLLFIIWNWISIFWSLEVNESIIRNITYTGLWLITFFTYQMVGSMRQLYGLMWSYVLGSWLAALGVIAVGQEIYHRYTLHGFNPNDMAFYILFSGPLAWFLGGKYYSLYQRGLAWGLIPIALTAALLTGSHSGAVGVGIVLLYVLISLLLERNFSLSTKSAILGSLIIIMVVATAVQLVPPHIYALLSTLPSELMHGTWNYRTIIWGAGLAVFSQFPLLGVGSGNFSRAIASLLGRPFAPHNAFLGIAVETGFFGFFLWVGMLIIVFRELKRNASRDVFLLWIFELTVLLVSLMTQVFEWRKPTWFLMALALSHTRIANFQRKRSSTSLSPASSVRC